MNGRQKWSSYLPNSFFHGLSTLVPLGYSRKAPGTVGSIAGVFWFTVVFYHLDSFSYLLTLAITIYLSVIFVDEAERRTYKRDPNEFILDEFVAIPVCFVGLHPYFGFGPPWVLIFAGFVLFRFYDILKPFGIRKLEEIPGGAGVVLDDVGAGVATCLTLHLTLWMLQL